MSERREGWYWVRPDYGNALWTVALLCEGVFVSIDGDFDDDGALEIGHRIPTPDEPWQTVPVEITAEMDEACEMEWREADEWQHLYAAMLKAAPKPGGA